MTKKFFILILTIVIFGCKVSNKISNKNIIIAPINPNESYYPLGIENTWKYKYVNSNDTQTVRVIEGNIEIEGKKYFKIIRTYTFGENTESFARNEDQVSYSFDYKTKGETFTIPNELVVGKIWYQADNSWKYEIISVTATLKTPTDKYDNLLQIKASQLTNRDSEKLQKYDLFYQKGIGQIAAKGNGQLMTYLIYSKVRQPG